MFRNRSSGRASKWIGTTCSAPAVDTPPAPLHSGEMVPRADVIPVPERHGDSGSARNCLFDQPMRNPIPQRTAICITGITVARHLGLKSNDARQTHAICHSAMLSDRTASHFPGAPADRPRPAARAPLCFLGGAGWEEAGGDARSGAAPEVAASRHDPARDHDLSAAPAAALRPVARASGSGLHRPVRLVGSRRAHC